MRESGRPPHAPIFFSHAEMRGLYHRHLSVYVLIIIPTPGRFFFLFFRSSCSYTAHPTFFLETCTLTLALIDLISFYFGPIHATDIRLSQKADLLVHDIDLSICAHRPPSDFFSFDPLGLPSYTN